MMLRPTHDGARPKTLGLFSYSPRERWVDDVVAYKDAASLLS